MKRFQKALLGVVVSGALLFSAQAAELSSAAKDTLQSAMIKVQQEIKDYIDNALVRCSNRSEVLACYVIIQGIMED